MTNKLNLKSVSFSVLGVLLAIMIFAVFGTLSASAALTSQMGVGSSGSQVSQLQEFLATNSMIYPEGIVSGYFGPLTRAAVVQFQVNYDIDQAGRVGPVTLARINEVMNSGLGLDISAPIMSNLTVQSSRQNATLGWNTNSQAQGKIYYSASPLSVAEASTRFTAPYINGSAVLGSGSNLAQSITLSDLQPNTKYYFFVQATDASGNVSVLWPERAFTTTQ